MSYFKPTLQGFSTISLEYDQPKNSREVLKKSIEQGCQAFIISSEVFQNFLSDFHKVHDESVQAFHNKHLMVYLTNIKERNLFQKIKNYPEIDGKKINSFVILKFT